MPKRFWRNSAERSKLPDSAVIDIIKQAKDEVSKKEADLEEREKELERQIEAFKTKAEK